MRIWCPKLALICNLLAHWPINFCLKYIFLLLQLCNVVSYIGNIICFCDVYIVDSFVNNLSISILCSCEKRLVKENTRGRSSKKGRGNHNGCINLVISSLPFETHKGPKIYCLGPHINIVLNTSLCFEYPSGIFRRSTLLASTTLAIKISLLCTKQWLGTLIVAMI